MGVEISFTNTPENLCIPNNTLSETYTQSMFSEIAQLISSGAIVEFPYSNPPSLQYIVFPIKDENFG